MHIQSSDDDTNGSPLLSKEYLGVSSGEMLSTEARSNGYTMRWWNSFRVEIKKYDSESSIVEGIITETNLRKESTSPSGDEVRNGSDLPLGTVNRIQHLVVYSYGVKCTCSTEYIVVVP